jgi:hypothetical protein
MKCDGEGCTNTRAWAFRDVGFWRGRRENLCDECYGFKYGEATCFVCERNCYEEEDYDPRTETHICGQCKRHQESLALDRAIEADMDHARNGL